MYYDITNPDVSYYWLHKTLQIKKDEFIETYIIECHNDFDTFYEKYRSIIDKIDIENLEIVAFQVTSSSNLTHVTYCLEPDKPLQTWASNPG